ncbi:MAG: NUDIX domain-containing protein [Acidobacteria bacterium]|nr:NUDIX domain-containing protein [Acidobacteriota bacterium]
MVDAAAPAPDVAEMLRDEYEAIHGPLSAASTGSLAPHTPPGAAPAPEDRLDDRLRALYGHVHALPGESGRSALCLSGGGIRSAAFSLGVLQALARAGVLQRVHYLSTVSGGGYIGAWLTAWIHRHFSANGPSGGTGPALAPRPRSEQLGEVSALLSSRGGGRAVGGDRPPEPEQVAHLRRFTNYLSPHTGAFSLDTWTLLAVYLRNLLLNWTVVVPLLCAALIVPMAFEGLVAATGFGDRARLAAVLLPAGLALAAWLAMIALTVARGRMSDAGSAERLSRWEGRTFRFGASWAALAALVLYGPALLREIPATLAAAGGLSGIGTYALKKLGDRGSPPGAAAGRPAWLVRAATTGAALLTIVLILIALSSAVQWLVGVAHQWPRIPNLPFWPGTSRVVAAAIVAAAALAISAVAAWIVDINEFSLHALYRNRLVRAFLRASRGAEAPESDTVFDAQDDLPLVRLWPQHPSWHDPDDAPHLFHVINATLNDLGGTRPEWNERKGVSFTFSPRHAGAHIAGRYREAEGAMRGGYRRLAPAGQSPDEVLHLGTAMSISGAAASPNMGYHSSPSVTFLMALFNVRLGWWMRPPWSSAGAMTALGGTPWTVWYAWWAEAFGGTRFNSAVLNVSDGGHFDNLGLYEMVRRRCRYIVVVDAGQDARHGFESLAEALRKIRIDFGVPITIGGLDLSDRGTGRAGAAPPAHAYYGTIHYSRVDHACRGDGRLEPAADGEIVYFRPAVSGDEPVDVQAYRRLHPRFPHETTADQWFSESQFESYRALGEHSVQHLLDYYDASKGQPQTAGAPSLTPQLFCHRVAESLALMRRHRGSSSHAGGVVYRKHEGRVEFLLVRSTDHLHRILPKGYIEPWEDAATAAVREVREEAGFTLATARSLGVASFETPTRRVTTTYFLMEEAAGAAPPRPYEDYRAPAWFTIDAARAADLKVPADVVQVLEKAQDAIASHAGGVVYRQGTGRVEFLLVRSKDGSCRVLPKGHIEPGEDAATAAAREVMEECGYRLMPGRSLGLFVFDTPAGDVSTRYFLMEPGAGVAPGPLDEPVRRPQWFTIGEARAADLPVPGGVFTVLEHAKAAIDAP